MHTYIYTHVCDIYQPSAKKSHEPTSHFPGQALAHFCGGKPECLQLFPHYRLSNDGKCKQNNPKTKF